MTEELSTTVYTTQNHSLHPFIVDVVKKGCFCSEDFDTVACIRNGLLALFIIVTALICFIQIIRLHRCQHSVIHHYIIFYAALIECILCSVQWIYIAYSEVDFAIQFLKLVQFLTVGHFFLSHTARVVQRENLIKWVANPILGAAFFYFLAVTIVGIVKTDKSGEGMLSAECLKPYWLMLSSVEFVYVQVFMIGGFFITKKLNKITMMDNVRRSQKKDLWGIIISFQLSAFVTFLYDFTIKIIGTEEQGCSGIFNNSQLIYTPIYAFMMLMKLMLPIWAELCVFQPISNRDNLEGTLSGSWGRDETFSSVFSRNTSNYRRLSAPSVIGDPGGAFTLPPPPAQGNLQHNISFPIMPPVYEEEHNNGFSTDPSYSTSS